MTKGCFYLVTKTGRIHANGDGTEWVTHDIKEAEKTLKAYWDIVEYEIIEGNPYIDK